LVARKKVKMGIGNGASAKQGIGQTGHRASAKQGIGQTGHWASAKQGIGQTGHWALGIMFLWGIASSPLLKRWCCYDESS
jgi:hypothetical protein